MRALLDVNMVIALLDANHIHHERAHVWWEANQKEGWASCPITENAVVRIMSHPSYRKDRLSPATVIELLKSFFAQSNHEFWADGISVCDEQVVERSQLLGSLQITDSYLLAVTVKNSGRLATLDGLISTRGVRGAEERHLARVS